MSLTFYYAPMSTADVTDAVLAELDLPHERVLLDIDAGGTRTADFLALNPNGRVPTIVHDGTAIWESSAITLYLGETFGVERGLFPPPGPARGEAFKWIVWANVTLAEAGGRLAATLPPEMGGVQPGSVDWVEPERRDPTALSGAQASVAAALAVLEGALRDQVFLLGAYSLADTHLYAFVGWLGMMGTDLTATSAVSGWMARCAARPALSRGDG